MDPGCFQPFCDLVPQAAIRWTERLGLVCFYFTSCTQLQAGKSVFGKAAVSGLVRHRGSKEGLADQAEGYSKQSHW